MAITAESIAARNSRPPLWKHKDTGQWCKKVRGKVFYFGCDEAAALIRWEAEKESILAKPKSAVEVKLDELAAQLEAAQSRVVAENQTTNQTTVGECCDHIVEAKRRQMKDGEFSARALRRWLATVSAAEDASSTSFETLA